MKGLVFNIQRYSIHDGPGIRTTVFLKGCPLRCFWCQNSESQKREPEIFLFKDRCTGCGKCVSVCPTGASYLVDESSEIDRDKCLGCGKCVNDCPNKARTLVGKYMAAEEVMQEVLRDRKFYESSGGGVTLSGGEPTYQPEFALALLQDCKREGLHTVLDTCGHVSWGVLEKLLEYVDLVFYDIKHVDRIKHLKGTGLPNEVILENARIVASQKETIIRVPLVPGFNDSPGDVKAIVHFVRNELGAVDVNLLPFNNMSEIKYGRLGKTCVHLETQSEEYIAELKAIASQTTN